MARPGNAAEIPLPPTRRACCVCLLLPSRSIKQISLSRFEKNLRRGRGVFEELRRPTFSGPCLRLNEVIRLLGYKRLREIDESSRKTKEFDTNVLLAASEGVLHV
jgi:hypothetical protein